MQIRVKQTGYYDEHGTKKVILLKEDESLQVFSLMDHSYNCENEQGQTVLVPHECAELVSQPIFIDMGM
jgi:hypothetical protein